MLQDGEITGKIIGCAMRVHTALGYGFPEIMYHRALAKELSMTGISFRSEAEITIHYKNEPIGTRRVDFLIDNIPVEIKAMVSLETSHFSQALNYLESYNLPMGLLLNFGSSSLQYHRLTNKRLFTDIPKILPKSHESQS